MAAVACLDISGAYEHVRHHHVHAAAHRHGHGGIASAATRIYGGPCGVCYGMQTAAELRATAGIWQGAPKPRLG
eukprot:2672268-Amphidinium_carterae.1